MKTIGEIVERNAFIYGSRLAIAGADGDLTWAELNRASNWVAWALQERGIRQKDRVALVSENSVSIVVLQYATAKLGAVLVPLNYRLVARELQELISDADPKVVIASERYRSLVKESLGGGKQADLLDLEELTPSGEESIPQIEPAVVHDHDPYMIVYTSGTTGRPKGVVRTHRLSFLNAIVGALERKIDETDVSILYTPNFHVSFWDTQMQMICLRGGGVIVTNGFAPAAYARLFREHRATTFFGLYTTLTAIRAESDPSDFASARRVVLPVKINDPQKIKDVVGFFGVDLSMVFSGWGMTETAPTCLTLSGDEWVRRPGCTGRAVPTADVRIADAAGKVAPAGVVGELEVRGEAVFEQYWRRPAETSAAFQGEWFRTGDRAWQDEDGYVYFFERGADIIKRGGETVSAVEVEEYLLRHPGVEEVAVIGVPDEKWEEAPLALIVRSPGKQVTSAEVLEFARTGLAGYKVPQHVEFVDSLPTVGIGKIARGKLREEYALKYRTTW